MFSSFYGLLDLLSGTELDSGQSEIGKGNINIQGFRLYVLQ